MGKRKYLLNESFFRHWSSEMAYVVGFVAADGYIYKKLGRLEITLAKKDLEHLMKIRDLLESNVPLIHIKKWDTFSLRIHSCKLIADLEKLGLFQNKSFTLLYPEVPQKFESSFCLGYFDGDGYLGISKGKSLIAEVRGTLKFLESLKARNKFAFGSIAFNDNMPRWRLSGKNAFNFCNWIYSDVKLCLNRKREIYENAKIVAVPKKSKTSKYKGVWFQNNKWRAGFRFGGKTVHLGSFNSEEEALLAYTKEIDKR
jgi:hypothetical protein